MTNNQQIVALATELNGVIAHIEQLHQQIKIEQSKQHDLERGIHTLLPTDNEGFRPSIVALPEIGVILRVERGFVQIVSDCAVIQSTDNNGDTK